MNNIPIAMDTSARACTSNRGRGGWNNSHRRLTNVGGSYPQQKCPNPNDRCYKCGSNKHWARNCDQINLINFMDEEMTPISSEETSSQNSYMSPAEIKAAIDAMSPEEKGELANSMDTREDFPNA
jgi:Zinc knuckle